MTIDLSHADCQNQTNPPTMASSADSTLPDMYESYPAIAPAKYAGKLDGKVVCDIPTVEQSSAAS